MPLFSRNPEEFLSKEMVDQIIEGLKNLLMTQEFVLQSRDLNCVGGVQRVFAKDAPHENEVFKGYINQPGGKVEFPFAPTLKNQSSYFKEETLSNKDILRQGIISLLYNYLSKLDGVNCQRLSKVTLQEKINNILKNLKNDLQKMMRPSRNMLLPHENEAYSQFISNIENYSSKIKSLIDPQLCMGSTDSERIKMIKSEITEGYEKFLTYMHAYQLRFDRVKFKAEISSITMDWGRDRSIMFINNNTELSQRLQGLDQSSQVLELYQALQSYVRSVCGISEFRAYQIMALAQQAVFGQSLLGIAASLMTDEFTYNYIQDKRKLKIFYNNNRVKLVLKLPCLRISFITNETSQALFYLVSTIELIWPCCDYGLPVLSDLKMDFEMLSGTFLPEVQAKLQLWKNTYSQTKKIIRKNNYDLVNSRDFFQYFKSESAIRILKNKTTSLYDEQQNNPGHYIHGVLQQNHDISIIGEIIGVHEEFFFTSILDVETRPGYLELLEKDKNGSLSQHEKNVLENFKKIKLSTIMQRAYDYLFYLEYNEIPVALRGLYSSLKSIIDFCRQSDNPYQKMEAYYTRENSVFKNNFDDFFNKLYEIKVGIALEQSNYLIWDALIKNVSIEMLCEDSPGQRMRATNSQGVVETISQADSSGGEVQDKRGASLGASSPQKSLKRFNSAPVRMRK